MRATFNVVPGDSSIMRKSNFLIPQMVSAVSSGTPGEEAGEGGAGSFKPQMEMSMLM